MGSFLNPVGPMSPSVYWRRRLVTFGVPIVVIALFAYGCSGSSVAPANQATGSPTGAGSAAPTQTTAIITPGPSPTGRLGSAPYYPSASPTGTATGVGGDSNVSTGCVLSVTVQLDKSAANGPPAYPGGQDPYFSVVVDNQGTANCRFDVSGRGIVITVTPVGSSATVWSSAACAKAEDLRALGPGEEYTATVQWTRVNAVTDCPTPSQNVNAGSYAVTATVLGVSAASQQFVLQ